jgi:TolB protein
VGLTQNRGVARTKIAFTSDRDSTKEKRSKELYIVDYDGFNPRRVTVNQSLNILPNWSSDGRSLAYVSYRLGSPEIFIASIFEGKSTNLTAGKAGQAFAPSWSPDGKRIAYASQKSGNMEIWVANADGSDAKRLTNSPGSDTAPAWNPSKQYSELAYTSRLEGGFEVAVVDLATRQVRQITQGRGSCEYPSWAPNGRHLVFACNRGQNWQITVSDRNGTEVQALATGPGNNVQPDWGP